MTTNDMQQFNEQLISTLKDSFSQLNESLSQQTQQSNTVLDAVNTTMHALQQSKGGSSKGASSLGHMPTFSGKENDAIEFIDNFNCYATFCNWTDKDKLAAIPLALIGSAKAWLFTNTDPYNTFDEFLFLFKRRFLSDTDDWVLRRQLSSRKQLIDEPVMDYATDIIKRCQRLRFSEQEQMYKFIEGLQPHLRDFVILREPKSLQEAINMAKIKHTVQPSAPVSAVTKKDIEELQATMLNVITDVKSNSINSVGFTQPHNRRTPQGSIDANLEALIDKKISDLFNQSPRFNSNSINSNYNRDNRRLRFTDNGRFGKPTRAVNGDPICYTCGRVGHTAAYCNQNIRNRQIRTNNRPRNNFNNNNYAHTNPYTTNAHPIYNNGNYQGTPYPQRRPNAGGNNTHTNTNNSSYNANPHVSHNNSQQNQSNSHGVRMSGNFAPQGQ